MDAAREDLQSYRSRADPELARHRKKSTDAHIQRLFQQLLSELVNGVAQNFYHREAADAVHVERVFTRFGFSKDFIARVINRFQKLAQKREELR